MVRVNELKMRKRFSTLKNSKYQNQTKYSILSTKISTLLIFKQKHLLIKIKYRCFDRDLMMKK